MSDTAPIVDYTNAATRQYSWGDPGAATMFGTSAVADSDTPISTIQQRMNTGPETAFGGPDSSASLNSFLDSLLLPGLKQSTNQAQPNPNDPLNDLMKRYGTENFGGLVANPDPSKNSAKSAETLSGKIYNLITNPASVRRLIFGTLGLILVAVGAFGLVSGSTSPAAIAGAIKSTLGAKGKG